jgi:hypothetical protein
MRLGMKKGLIENLVEKRKTEDIAEKAMGGPDLLEGLFNGIC